MWRLLVGLVACACAVGAIQAEQTNPRQASVTRAIDGSSLDAHVDGQRTALGYLGVETPQLNQPCGPEALARNRALAGSAVLVEADPLYELDEIGRRLYYVYTLDGRSIDELLVREGFGLAVRTDASHGEALIAAQADAQASARGCLWSGKLAG